MSWFEKQTRETVDTKGKVRNIAPVHQDCHKGCGGTTPITPPLSNAEKQDEETEMVKITFDKDIEHDKNFIKLLDEFAKQQGGPEDLESVLWGKQLQIPSKHANAFKKFLVKQGIKVTEDDK